MTTIPTADCQVCFDPATVHVPPFHLCAPCAVDFSSAFLATAIASTDPECVRGAEAAFIDAFRLAVKRRQIEEWRGELVSAFPSLAGVGEASHE